MAEDASAHHHLKTARERDEDERLALRRAGPARNDFAPESLSTFAEVRRLRQ